MTSETVETNIFYFCDFVSLFDSNCYLTVGRPVIAGAEGAKKFRLENSFAKEVAPEKKR
jgi:hypothetical protein